MNFLNYGSLRFSLLRHEVLWTEQQAVFASLPNLPFGSSFLVLFDILSFDLDTHFPLIFPIGPQQSTGE